MGLVAPVAEAAPRPKQIASQDQLLGPPVANGAPLRWRVERQLGYKHAKSVMRLELVEDFKHIDKERGGYWEDQGPQWYAGIQGHAASSIHRHGLYRPESMRSTAPSKNHRSNSRFQAAKSEVAEAGQVIFIITAP
ncbi:MAG: molybdopterin-dependent oxidoreductase [Ideonella sp.]|jgi:DMSO/TMAO reductase YedYZ molybdopterin-dependent catalytic subunit|nr:molybdopterin-dependent oxidoreductase [Ideonella sp.]